MKKNFIILLIATLLSSLGAILKILHKGEPYADILLIVSLGPYLFSISRLMFSKYNINAAKEGK